MEWRWNRGYQKPRVWEGAIEFYKVCSQPFRNLPFGLKRVRSQTITAADSVHQNIAEGYCCRSIQEYIQHLYIALGSLGESLELALEQNRNDEKWNDTLGTWKK